MNIYVGNLSSDVTDDDLRQAFESYGVVESVKIIMDRYTGESRGFGFVDMPLLDEAKAAIEGLTDSELKGQILRVSKARSRFDGRKGGGRRDGGKNRRSQGDRNRRSWY